MKWIGVVTLSAILLTGSLARASAQTMVGAQYGTGEGSANYDHFGANIQTAVSPRLLASGEVRYMGASWACVGGPVSEYVCNYDGLTISGGPGLTLIDGSRMQLSARGFGGVFIRTGNDSPGNKEFTTGVGMDVRLLLWSPIWLHGSASQQWIHDGRHEDLAGELPHASYVSIGLSYSIWGRNNDG